MIAEPGKRMIMAEKPPQRPSADRYEVIPAASGAPTLTARDGDREISLHSRIDPEKEAAAIVSRLEVEPGGILVILGLGLGYHVEAALEKIPFDACVVVVEADEEIQRLADVRGFRYRGRDLIVLTGLDRDEAMSRITALRMDRSLAKLTILAHPPSLRLRPDYYGRLKGILDQTAASPLRERLIHPRLKQERLNVLVLDTGYYLLDEVHRALAAMGHDVRKLPLGNARATSREDLRSLLSLAASFQPDFLLTINHLGFDTAGVLTDLLERLKLPVASWFVDSPLMILEGARNCASDWVSVFLWDSDYLEEVKALGFEKVHYLPLGTDATRFRPPAAGQAAPLAKAGFVGDSMVKPVLRYMTALGLGPAHMPEIDRAAFEFAGDDRTTPSEAIIRGGLSKKDWAAALDSEGLKNLNTLVTFRATQIYRLELVKSLAPFAPAVAGDSGWVKLLNPAEFRLLPEIDYYSGLPGFYPRCQVNLNVTSLQMKTGLNQRVFDVPACGGFLLTDARRQLDELFDVGREAIAYGNAGELEDLTRYYLAHESERRRVIEKGRARVLAEHTYVHRLSRLIERMREDHS